MRWRRRARPAPIASASVAGTTSRTSTPKDCAAAARATCAGRARPAGMSSGWRWFALSAVIVAAHQFTKWLVLGYFENRYPRVELTSFFNLVLVFNKGAALSLFAQAAGWQTPLLAGFALAAAVIVSVLIVRNPGRGLLCLGLALILGGAVGNLIDRLR